eukprot:gnl/Spiro4/15336_TR8243_c0_g2_i1.p1 gnl/Spiro4/15336_TR8243_c0_g2~~gnl/Spiro4/15336_TR8243_c0_g2_i1.p1  ORF type:complete len:246 (+),score=71.22 gnl/Spiro4/15336_TR8243_c0_g2_i1:234-971(+)
MALSGKKVCVTGTLSQGRKIVEASLIAQGAQVMSGVSKNVDIVIAGDKAGSKLEKAEELGCTVWTEAQMNAALAGSAGAGSKRPAPAKASGKAAKKSKKNDESDDEDAPPPPKATGKKAKGAAAAGKKAAAKPAAKKAPAAKRAKKAASDEEDNSGDDAPPPPRSSGGSSGSVKGMKVAITGKLKHNRPVYEAAVARAGGKFASGISKNVNILICGDAAGSKLSKAQELGIEIWSPEKADEVLGL